MRLRHPNFLRRTSTAVLLTSLIATCTIASAGAQEATPTCRFKSNVEKLVGTRSVPDFESSYTDMFLYSSSATGKISENGCGWKFVKDGEELSIDVAEVFADKGDTFSGMLRFNRYVESSAPEFVKIEGRPAVAFLEDGDAQVVVSLPKLTLWITRNKSSKTELKSLQALAATLLQGPYRSSTAKCRQLDASVKSLYPTTKSEGSFEDESVGTSGSYTVKGCSYANETQSLDIGTSNAKDFANWSKGLEAPTPKSYTDVSAGPNRGFIIRTGGPQANDQAVVATAKKAIRVTVSPASKSGPSQALALAVARAIAKA
jgi:hypothetical protein